MNDNKLLLKKRKMRGGWKRELKVQNAKSQKHTGNII